MQSAEGGEERLKYKQADEHKQQERRNNSA